MLYTTGNNATTNKTSVEFTATSRLRRKIKSKLDKLQSNIATSCQDLSAIGKRSPSPASKAVRKSNSATNLQNLDSVNGPSPPCDTTTPHHYGNYLQLPSTNGSLGSDNSRISTSTSTSDDSEADFMNKNIQIVISKIDDGNNKMDVNFFERIGQKIKKHKYFQKSSRTLDVSRRLKSQIWSSVVTIALVEGKNLPVCDPDSGSSDPYVKFRLGNEKYKSRIVWRSLNPRWLEQFDLHLYDDGDQQLEITVWDKDRSRDDFIGRTSINLAQLERETTHSIWKDLEDGSGSLHLLVTISGTTASETISDLTSYEENPKEKANLENRYALHRTFHNLRDVGHLTCKVYRAQGLAAADLGGKSDPFCVLELGNARLQTQTEYKTLSPSWQKIFTFNIKDINNVLDITVFDEDRDHKVEFLGRIAIPLLRIKSGEKRWYALKDRKLRSRAKGNNPQILLEMQIAWNPVRAYIRTINPKEEKFMQTDVKFKRQVFVRNVVRLKRFLLYFYDFSKMFDNCFEWESKTYSFIALLFFLVLCYYFEPWMIPVGGLLIFLKQFIVRSLSGPSAVPWDETLDSDFDEEDDEEKEKEEKKSLKERLLAIQEVTQGVQNAIGKIASLLESVKNTFNFTVPYLSWIAISLLLVAAIVLYFIPVRYLLMLWGANKFLRRILRPDSVPNNEVMDLLSRVPDDEMLNNGLKSKSAQFRFTSVCWTVDKVIMWLKLLATVLAHDISRFTLFHWFLQLDYRELKIISSLTGEAGRGGSSNAKDSKSRLKLKAS